MTMARSFLVLILVLSNLPLFAQKTDEDEAAKEKQRQQTMLIDSIITDSRELRLPENRAIVFAKVGTRIWDSDRKRAEDLFRDAITELLAAQTEAEANRLRGRQSELLTSQNIRPQILQTIANRDADFALKSLYRTRPPAIERAMAGVTAKDSKIRNSPGNDAYLAQNELNLEQNIARQAADQNSEKAVALLQATLKKGVTGEALSLLRKLHEKNPAAAADMGSEIAAQLIKKSFTLSGNQHDYAALQVSFAFLNDHVQQRPPQDRTFRFTTADMKSLADKLITFFLDRNNQSAAGWIQQMIPIADKMRPDAIEKLRELEKTSPWREGSHRIAQDPEVTKLLNGETTVEEMLEKAAKLPIENRGQIYHAAANRLAAAGDVTRARQLIDDNFSDDALTKAQESLNWYYAHQLINQGKFTDAEVLIDQFPEGNRFAALITLADTLYNNDPEHKNRALSVLSKASAMLPPEPETSSEMQQMIQLITAYTRIEPAEGFRLFDSLVPKMNELADASAILSGFQGNYNYRRGEMLVTAGNSLGVYVDASVFRGLAQKDFDRTLSLIGTFSRREMRIGLKQQLLESL